MLCTLPGSMVTMLPATAHDSNRTRRLQQPYKAWLMVGHLLVSQHWNSRPGGTRVVASGPVWSKGFHSGGFCIWIAVLAWLQWHPDL